MNDTIAHVRSAFIRKNRLNQTMKETLERAEKNLKVNQFFFLYIDLCSCLSLSFLPGRFFESGPK